MSGFILGIHEDSPIDLGNRQFFFINNQESPQWPKMLGKKGEYMGQYKSHLLSMTPMDENHQCMIKV